MNTADKSLTSEKSYIAKNTVELLNKTFRQDLRVYMPGLTIIRNGKWTDKGAEWFKRMSNGTCEGKDVRLLNVAINEKIYVPRIGKVAWLRGFLKRMAPPTNVDVKSLRVVEQVVTEFLASKNMTPLEHIELTEENLNELWLNESNYSEKQKEHYRKVFNKWVEDGAAVNEKDRLFYKISSFIKSEVYEEDKESRTISAPSDIVKCLTALAIKPIEQKIYDNHYIKHHTREQIMGQVNKIREYPILYETDYSSFEGTISVPIMQAIELRIFKYLLSNNPELYQIIENVDLGYSWYEYSDKEGVINAKMSGSRKSGCLWTSLGNGLTNEILMRTVAKVNHANVQYLVEGDDGLIGTNRVLDFSILSKLGFVLKCEPCTDINELSFCGMIFSGRNKLTCKMHRTLKQMSVSFNIPSGSTPGALMARQAYLKMKAISYYYMYPRTPVVSEICQAIIQQLNKIEIKPYMLGWWETNVIPQMMVQSRLDFKIHPGEDDIKFAEKHFGLNVYGYHRFKTEIATLDLVNENYKINMELLFDGILDSTVDLSFYD